jgi:hypothetical protein
MIKTSVMPSPVGILIKRPAVSALDYRSLLMDRQLRVTHNVCEQHMRDLELNFLFNLGGHMDSHGNARRKDTLK